jgi:hypothetical protein
VKRAQPTFRRFLNRFTDNFGQNFEPTVLIVSANAPPAFRDIAALASFRDLIAISTITHSRALELLRRRGPRVMFGEAFAIYPWMLDRHYEDLLAEALRVAGDDDPVPVPSVRERFARWADASGASGEPSTVRLPGRDGRYVLFAAAAPA